MLMLLSFALMSSTFLSRGWKWIGLAGTLLGIIAATVIFEELLLLNRIIGTVLLGDFVFHYLIFPHLLGSAWLVITGLIVLRMGERSISQLKLLSRA